MLHNGTPWWKFARSIPGGRARSGSDRGSCPRSDGRARTVLFVQRARSPTGQCERLAAKLRGGGYGKIFVRDTSSQAAKCTGCA